MTASVGLTKLQLNEINSRRRRAGIKLDELAAEIGSKRKYLGECMRGVKRPSRIYALRTIAAIVKIRRRNAERYEREVASAIAEDVE